jgi:hypothetical protein
MVAFFMETKTTHATLEDAMDWIDRQAHRFGMRGHEAEARGLAQIFRA